MGHLEPKLLRFQGLFWRINHFCILLRCGDIAENVKNTISAKMLICKKKIRENLRLINGPVKPIFYHFLIINYKIYQIS